ncbi:MAG: right-handed parallel beta-helix repeat-containing protein, partial [Planctomycetota bacterium]
MEFTAEQGGANPDPNILSIWRDGGNGALNWTVAEDCNWLTVDPTSGRSMGEVDDCNVTVDITGLTEGLYNCQLTVDAGTAANSPQIVDVNLRVYPYGLYVPREYGTIQAAINAAVDGDTIIIEPGTYTGTGNRDLDFGGKAITVQSTDPEDPCVVGATIIDCNAATRGFYFHNNEDSNSILDGLTITKASGGYGGGIYCYESSPTIRNCIVRDNTVDIGGGGIALIDSNSSVSHCTISRNTAGPDGGAMYIGAGSADRTPEITNCIISGNFAGRAGGIYSEGPGSNPVFRNCIIAGNDGGAGYGGGLYTDHSSNPSLYNCTISGNKAGAGGGLYGWSDLEVRDCIVWANEPDGIDEHVDPKHGTYVTVNYSLLQSMWAGTGNMVADPRFYDAGYWDPNGTPGDTSDDFWVDGGHHLLLDSPCVDAGDPNYSPPPGETDIDGQIRIYNGRVDMGADEAIPMDPYIYPLPRDFDFYAYAGGFNPESQILSISNIGTDTLNWEIEEDCNWLTADPNSGQSSGEVNEVTLSVDISG